MADGETHAGLFLRIQERFGPIVVDLAATDQNTKAERWITPEQNTFKVDWAAELANGRGWLNPPPPEEPFEENWAQLDPWALKSVYEAERGARIVSAWPVVMDTRWFWHIVPNAALYVVRPWNCRIDYEGEAIPLMIAVFGDRNKGRLQEWRFEVPR